jgi:hypothetical protein
LAEELKAIEQKFKRHQQYLLNQGKRLPTELSPDLAEEKAHIEARMAVLNEEIEFLEREIKHATKKKTEVEESALPRRRWGTGRMQNGVLVSLGGFRISAEQDGLLRINDSRSTHDGMEAWRFREHIIKPMAWEHSHRVQTEKEAAKAENRPIKQVPYPESGIWHRNSNTIEYPGYSDTVLKIIKEIQ